MQFITYNMSLVKKNWLFMLFLNFFFVLKLLKNKRQIIFLLTIEKENCTDSTFELFKIKKILQNCIYKLLWQYQSPF